MGDILKSLGLDGRVFLIQVVGFLLLYWILSKYLFGPIKAVLATRQENIQKDYDTAEKSRHDMEALKGEYEKRMESLEAEARTHIQDAIKEGQAAREQILAEARVEAQKAVDRGRQEIEHERDRAVVELRSEVANLAVGAAGKIVKESMDDARHRQMVDDFINQVGRA